MNTVWLKAHLRDLNHWKAAFSNTCELVCQTKIRGLFTKVQTMKSQNVFSETLKIWTKANISVRHLGDLIRRDGSSNCHTKHVPICPVTQFYRQLTALRTALHFCSTSLSSTAPTLKGTYLLGRNSAATTSNSNFTSNRDRIEWRS